MIIRMLVSVSRSDGFSARIGQELAVDDAIAQDLLTNEQAEPVGTIKLPRERKAKPVSPDPSATPVTESGTINLADGVDSDEASLAGKTLQRRRGGMP